jgi:hypothetical protein
VTHKEFRIARSQGNLARTPDVSVVHQEKVLHVDMGFFQNAMFGKKSHVDMGIFIIIKKIPC